MSTPAKYPKSMPPNGPIYIGLCIGGFIIGTVTGFFPRCKPEISNEKAKQAMQQMGWPESLTGGERTGTYETEEITDDKGYTFSVEYNFMKDYPPILLLVGLLYFVTNITEAVFTVSIISKMCGCCNDFCGQDQGSWADTCCKCCKCPCGGVYTGFVVFNGLAAVLLSIGMTGTHEGPSYKMKYKNQPLFAAILDDIEVKIPEGEVSYSSMIGQIFGILFGLIQMGFGAWLGAVLIGKSREAWEREMEEIKRSQIGGGPGGMMPGMMVGPPMMIAQPQVLDANGNPIPGQQPMMMMMQPMGGVPEGGVVPGAAGTMNVIGAPQPGVIASGTPISSGGGGAKVVPI